jgi:hypothetical protein
MPPERAMDPIPLYFAGCPENDSCCHFFSSLTTQMPIAYLLCQDPNGKISLLALKEFTSAVRLIIIPRSKIIYKLTMPTVLSAGINIFRLTHSGMTDPKW